MNKRSRSPFFIFGIILVCFIGICLRVKYINLYPQVGIFDQIQYDDYARKILDFGIYADTFRIYGYPIFIAGLYRIFGIASKAGSLYIWQLVQIGIDIAAGILVYKISRHLFKSSGIALFSFILYILNPFTGVYTGVMLPELLAAFLIILLLYLYLGNLTNFNLPGIVLIGLLLGYIPQVRPMFFPYAIILFLATLMRIFIKQKILVLRLGLILIFIASFIIPFIYTITGNWRWYKEFSVTDVDKLYLENFYISLFINNEAQMTSNIWTMPAPVRDIYSQYSYRAEDRIWQHSNQKLYWNKSLEEIAKNPLRFVLWRLQKMWYVWEKHKLYPYSNPTVNWFSSGVYTINSLILLISGIGILLWAKSVWRRGKDWFWQIFLMVFPLLATAGASAFTTGEERYSIPVYPILILFAGFGLYRMMLLFKHINFLFFVPIAKPVGYR
jgi:hypothetical protein